MREGGQEEGEGEPWALGPGPLGNKGALGPSPLGNKGALGPITVSK